MLLLMFIIKEFYCNGYILNYNGFIKKITKLAISKTKHTFSLNINICLAGTFVKTDRFVHSLSGGKNTC